MKYLPLILRELLRFILIFGFLLFILMVILSAHGQGRISCDWPRATARITALSNAVGQNGTVIYVNSDFCMESEGPNRKQQLFIDGELMDIVEVQTGIVVVRRGKGNTASAPHRQGAIVFFSTAYIFKQQVGI